MVDYQTHLLCMWEVPGSDVVPEIRYPEEVFLDFPQSLR
jgi:hypothetical protein